MLVMLLEEILGKVMIALKRVIVMVVMIMVDMLEELLQVEITMDVESRKKMGLEGRRWEGEGLLVEERS